MAGADTAKCDNAAASPQLSSHFQGHRTTDTPYKVISLQGLDLNEVSNDTAERLIDALNEGAQFDKESLVILMSMRRRLSSATAEWLIAAVNSGASLDKESLIKLSSILQSSLIPLVVVHACCRKSRCAGGAVSMCFFKTWFDANWHLANPFDTIFGSQRYVQNLDLVHSIDKCSSQSYSLLGKDPVDKLETK
eukprot:scaffold16363_cov131-Cylindrotheca_fusiformis.AAC.1